MLPFSLGIPPTTTLVASPEECVSIQFIIRENFKSASYSYQKTVYIPFLDLNSVPHEFNVQGCAEKSGYVEDADLEDWVENCPGCSLDQEYYQGQSHE